MRRFDRTILFLAVVLTAAASLTARANIGEDMVQLRARYGSAQSVGAQMLFQHDGYSICVYFDGPKSAMEVYCRDGSNKDKTDITSDDIDQILASQADGQTWAPIPNDKGKPTWLRSDHKLVARFTAGNGPDDKFFTVMLNAK